MAFNLGAALGAATQSGINTYTKLGEEQRQEEELAMRRKEAAYQEEQRQQERKLNEISSQTLGMGDTRVTGQDYTGVTGGIDTAEPALRTEAYTPQQKMADFKQRALGAGIPIQKVTAISSAHRAERYAEAEDMAMDFSRQVMDDVKANPTNLKAVFDKHFKDQYNEGKLPGLGDGKTADVVPTATGGDSIVLKDAKGKVTKTIPLNIDTIQALTQKWTGAMMASSSPASWWKSREEDLKSRQVGAAEKTADAHLLSAKAAWANAGTAAEGAKAKNKYWEAAAEKMGRTKADDMKEAVSVQADLIQKADPKINRAQAELQAANKLLHSAESKAAVVTGEQVQKFLDSPEGDQLKYKTEGGRKVKRTPEERQTEAIRILSMRNQQTSALPTGGSNANALLDQAMKHATDEDFK